MLTVTFKLSNLICCQLLQIGSIIHPNGSVTCDIQEPIRKKHHLKPFVVPRRLQKDLPFDYKPKVKGKWADPVLKKRVAVIRDSHEKKRDQLINQMRAIHTVKEIKTREDRQQRHRDYR